MSARLSALRSTTAVAATLAIAMTAALGSLASAQPSPPAGSGTVLAQAAETTEPVATDTGLCRRLTDFTENDSSGWFVVNDGVMGGRSDGGGFIDDSILRFEGTVVTAGGGFTSARLQLDGDELTGSNRIEMRVRPDGRTYGVTLDDDAQFRGRFVSHRADFDIGPVDDEGWAIASVEYDQLVPSVFGLLVDAPQFDPATAREFGIIIADGIDGDFVIDIDWIDACP
jgi:hypothetical protein